MKRMKKILCIVLSIILALSVSAPAFAADKDSVDGLKIAVASDLHTMLTPENAPMFRDNMFANADDVGSLHDESIAVVDSFLYEAAEKGAEYILICGDITNYGTEIQYDNVVPALKKFQDDTGIQIYLVPGNHDYYEYGDEAVEKFKSAFSDFGYNQAYAVYEDNYTYAAELGDDYVLIAVDSNLPSKTGDGISEELYSWVEQQAKLAKENGKNVMLMMHHPIMPHFFLNDVIEQAFVVKNWRNVCSRFADLGVKYVLTGHKHVNDIAVYQSAKGNEIYDITTASLVSYPFTYRMATFSDSGVSIRSNQTQKIRDMSLLPKGYSDEAYELMKTNLPEYSDKFFDATCDNAVQMYVNEDKLAELIGNDDVLIKGTLKGICDRAKEILYAPLYGEEGSLEAVAKQYDTVLPKCDYDSLLEFAINILKIHSGGDANLPADSDEAKLFTRALSIFIAYTFEGVPNDLKVTIFNALFDAVNIDPSVLGVSIEAISFAHTADSDFAFALVDAMLEPVINGILVDDAPADNNADLPPYGSVNESITFTSALDIVLKIIKFVSKLLTYIFSVLDIALK